MGDFKQGKDFINVPLKKITLLCGRWVVQGQEVKKGGQLLSLTWKTVIA